MTEVVCMVSRGTCAVYLASSVSNVGLVSPKPVSPDVNWLLVRSSCGCHVVWVGGLDPMSEYWDADWPPVAVLGRVGLECSDGVFVYSSGRSEFVSVVVGYEPAGVGYCTAYGGWCPAVLMWTDDEASVVSEVSALSVLSY